MQTKSIIIGIGDLSRGDDALGPKAISLLDNNQLMGIQTKTLSSDLTLLLDIFNHYENVLLIDAIVTQQAPVGTFYRLEGEAIRGIATRCRTSTHAFDLAQTLDMATILNCEPKKLILFGLEANNFDYGHALNPALEQKLPFLLTEIYHEIKGLSCTNIV